MSRSQTSVSLQEGTAGQLAARSESSACPTAQQASDWLGAKGAWFSRWATATDASARDRRGIRNGRLVPGSVSPIVLGQPQDRRTLATGKFPVTVNPEAEMLYVRNAKRLCA